MIVLTFYSVMNSGSQNLFYTHEYPLSENEFIENAAAASLGTGVYLYFINQNSGEVIPFSEVKRYLSVTFKDGSGDPYASSICSDTEMFLDT